MSGLSLPALLPWLVGLPLLAAAASFAGQRWVAGRWLNAVGAAAQLALAVLVLWLLAAGDSGLGQRYTLGGWGAPLGIDLYIDGFAGLMIAITAALGFVLSLYSCSYFTEPDQAARFWPLWWLLMVALNAVFLAADAFNIYVTLEILGLAAVALVALQGGRPALQAALRYLLVGLLGSLCYLLGVALLYRAYGTLDLAQLGQLVHAAPLSWAALGLITVGLLLKTALLPLHFWLPPAHANAPAPVSAALSALVVKASFYLLARFWLETLSAATTAQGLQVLGVLGAAAVLVGSIQAIRAQRLKLIVAYSTVAQLGYLFLLFPLFGRPSDTAGLGGAVVDAVAYFIIAHACAKAAMFLAAGNIQRAAGHDDISRLHGIARRQPLSLFAFAIAGASLIGLPPSGGFVAKWLLLNAAIDAGQWWWLITVIAGGLLAAVYVFRVLNLAFTDSAEQPPAAEAQPVLPRLLPLGAFALAIITVLLGFNALWVLEVLDIGVPPLQLAADGEAL
ncbi:oxidoreductase [Exilibacterium tricleocarpae]|uniref:Oxidoreductase n=1 Tax=Exilibacterium tricleocarpae TaxID=2591008 RepID=A0A545U6L7_9GAMM|nr:proton-conducting transporter membrane subunit [Exilibacterium tricleocarpae]TQV85118.1 oxidoreductase [Exilibacterium tricleocarpae]